MIKQLLIGASALAFATVAQAQTVTDIVVTDDYGEIFNAPAFDAAVRAANHPGNGGNANTNQANDADTAANVDAATSTAFIGNITAGKVTINAAGNQAGVEQDGNSNDAEVTQNNGRRGWAVVNQLGSNSDATVTQRDGSSSASTGISLNRAYIGQVSAASEATDDTQIATISQAFTAGTVGDTRGFNSASILQGGQVIAGGRATGRDNRASITQNGGGNDGIIFQGADVAHGGAVGSGNRATLSQTGGGNFASIQQEDDAVATTTQLGQGNKAYVLQDDGTGNLSTIKQDGRDNFAAVSQDNGGRSYIEQEGDENQSFVEQRLLADSAIEQKGTDNFASVLQIDTATGAYSSVKQNGIGNNAWIYQSVAAGSDSVVSQNGNSNVAIVRQ